MRKIPRFMKEYASFQIKSMYENELMSYNAKEEACQKITMAQAFYSRGSLTVTEAMDIICHCFAD